MHIGHAPHQESPPKEQILLGGLSFLPHFPPPPPALRRKGTGVPSSSTTNGKQPPIFGSVAAAFAPFSPTSKTFRAQLNTHEQLLITISHGTHSPSRTHSTTRPRPIPRKGAIKPQRARCGAPPRLPFGRSQRNHAATSCVRGLRALPRQCAPHTNCRRHLRALRCRSDKLPQTPEPLHTTRSRRPHRQHQRPRCRPRRATLQQHRRQSRGPRARPKNSTSIPIVSSITVSKPSSTPTTTAAT